MPDTLPGCGWLTPELKWDLGQIHPPYSISTYTDTDTSIYPQICVYIYIPYIHIYPRILYRKSAHPHVDHATTGPTGGITCDSTHLSWPSLHHLWSLSQYQPSFFLSHHSSHTVRSFGLATRAITITTGMGPWDYQLVYTPTPTANICKYTIVHPS